MFTEIGLILNDTNKFSQILSKLMDYMSKENDNGFEDENTNLETYHQPDELNKIETNPTEIDLMAKSKNHYDQINNLYNVYADINQINSKENLEKEVNKIHYQKNIKQDNIDNTNIKSSINNDDMVYKGELYKVKLIGYRKSEIKQHTDNGNFFILEKLNDYDYVYNLEFDEDDILCIEQEKIDNPKYKHNPLLFLLDKWFNVDEIKDIKQKNPNVDKQQLLGKIVKDKIIEKGYKAVKYGNNLLQVVELK